jgi:hypothetical protein
VLCLFVVDAKRRRVAALSCSFWADNVDLEDYCDAGNPIILN